MELNDLKLQKHSIIDPWLNIPSFTLPFVHGPIHRQLQITIQMQNSLKYEIIENNLTTFILINDNTV